jgi:hypothetical protein
MGADAFAKLRSKLVASNFFAWWVETLQLLKSKVSPLRLGQG